MLIIVQLTTTPEQAGLALLHNTKSRAHTLLRLALSHSALSIIQAHSGSDMPTLRATLAAPPPSHALPALPDENESRQHSRRRTDSSDAIVLEESETGKLSNPPVYPLWAVKWGQDPEEVALAH